MATFAPNSAAIVMVDSAEKTVKLVAMDPTSAASTSTLSASGTDPDAAICQTRPKFGSQVARMKTASPTADARMTYRASVKRSEEHTSELQSLMRISYAVFCLKKKKI